jgi:hypothetical protein
MPAKKVDESPVYQLKVTIQGIRPPIWRRLQVRGSATLPKLHDAIQIAMGWTDSHLHMFNVGGVSYGLPDPGLDDVRSEQRVKLGQIVSGAKDRFTYEYDFGDSWEHEILVEKVLPPDPGVHYPICLAGKRACPPEDVGGVWGYADFLDAIAHPEHAEHEEMLEWVGGAFDPEAFDLQAVNGALKRL